MYYSPVVKHILVVALIIFMSTLDVANSAGECGKNSPDMEALKLIPCASAAQDSTSSPSGSCCKQVKQLGKNPSCLCAVMMSNTAKASGVKPENAITIPKRCNFADRPVGYQCGGVVCFEQYAEGVSHLTIFSAILAYTLP